MALKTIAVNSFTSQETALTTLQKVQSALQDSIFTSAAIAIGTTTTKVKTATATKFFINDVYGNLAVTDDFWTLAGTVTNAKFNVFLLYITSAGVAGMVMGTEGATRATVVMPALPANCAPVGLLEINPTGTGNFVGGTTALGDATVVPNAVYINTPGNLRLAANTL